MAIGVGSDLKLKRIVCFVIFVFCCCCCFFFLGGGGEVEIGCKINLS